MLMCGAIFEGLLHDRIGSDSIFNFNKLIKNAESKGLISNTEMKLFNRIRTYRNIVHLGNADNYYVERIDVMDTRKALDEIITRFSKSTDSHKVSRLLGG